MLYLIALLQEEEKKVVLICRTFLSSFLLLSVMLLSIKIAYATNASDELKLVNEELYLFSDTSGNSTIADAIVKFQDEQFISNSEAKVSFGFTQATLWAVLPVTNQSQSDNNLIIQIDNSLFKMTNY